MSSQEPSLVARRIREVRDQKRLSRQQLADRLAENQRPSDRPKWTYLQVYRIETGVTHISAEVAGEVAGALGVSVAFLYRKARAS